MASCFLYKRWRRLTGAAIWQVVVVALMLAVPNHRIEAAGTMGDLNGDGVVNINDLIIVTANFGKTATDAGWNAQADANGDEVVNNSDLIIVIANFAREGDTKLTLSTDKKNVTVGDTFTITLSLADAAPFASWQNLLGFDSGANLLSLVAQNVGSFATFVQDSRSLLSINQSAEIRAGGFSLTDNDGGSGTLGSFVFTVADSLPPETTIPAPVVITTENYSATNLFGNRFTSKSGVDFMPTVSVGQLTINVWPENTAPVVAAGEDKTIRLPNTVTLTGTISDDGLPNPPATVNLQWTKVMGPGTVAFSAPNSAVTTATISEAGSYTLRLTADDGSLTSMDEVSIVVEPAPEVYFITQDVLYVERGGTAEIPITIRGRNVDLSSLILDYLTGSQEVFANAFFK